MSQSPIRAQIMSKGIQMTTEFRNQAYGDPMVNLAAAGELKAMMRKHLTRADLPLGVLEALDQVQTKIARIITGTQVVEDNYIDGSTYFAIAGEIDLRFLEARNKAAPEAPAEATSGE